MIEARQMGIVAIGHAHQDTTKSTPEGLLTKSNPALLNAQICERYRGALRASGRSVLGLGKMPEVACNPPVS